MGFRLRSGLHCCAFDGRLIFLDLCTDRYFCLSERAEAEFAMLMREETNGEVDLQPGSFLLRSGIVEHSHSARIELCRSLPIPQPSALDWRGSQASGTDKMSALATLTVVKAHLRLRGLARAIDALVRVKARSLTVEARFREVARAADALAWTARWGRSHDQCLPRSLAAARLLLRRGANVDFVIGVRLRPFEAHSWAQSGDVIVNDRFEHVRNYQPILVV
jgi:hypothetical protein